MSDFVELVERDQRADALRTAKQQALRLIAPEQASDRSHILSKEQWRRFRASADPLAEYPDETERFVAFYYDRIRRAQGFTSTNVYNLLDAAYEEEVGTYNDDDFEPVKRPILLSRQFWAGVAFALVGLAGVVAIANV